jgi:hypothetical protein
MTDPKNPKFPPTYDDAAQEQPGDEDAQDREREQGRLKAIGEVRDLVSDLADEGEQPDVAAIALLDIAQSLAQSDDEDQVELGYILMKLALFRVVPLDNLPIRKLCEVVREMSEMITQTFILAKVTTGLQKILGKSGVGFKIVDGDSLKTLFNSADYPMGDEEEEEKDSEGI